MKCSVCGSKVLKNDNFCENCGADLKVNQPIEKKNDELAIVGFVLSFIIPLAGLIVSCIAHNKIKKQDLSGKEFALAGIIISAVSLGLNIIYTAFNLVSLIEIVLAMLLPIIEALQM